MLTHVVYPEPDEIAERILKRSNALFYAIARARGQDVGVCEDKIFQTMAEAFAITLVAISSMKNCVLQLGHDELQKAAMSIVSASFPFGKLHGHQAGGSLPGQDVTATALPSAGLSAEPTASPSGKQRTSGPASFAGAAVAAGMASTLPPIQAPTPNMTFGEGCAAYQPDMAAGAAYAPFHPGAALRTGSIPSQPGMTPETGYTRIPPGVAVGIGCDSFPSDAVGAAQPQLSMPSGNIYTQMPPATPMGVVCDSILPQDPQGTVGGAGSAQPQLGMTAGTEYNHNPLATVAGSAYDSSRQEIVRGAEYAHPHLGITPGTQYTQMPPGTAMVVGHESFLREAAGGARYAQFQQGTAPWTGYTQMPPGMQ